MPNKIGVVYACNTNYLMPTVVSLTSVLYNNKNAPIKVDISVFIFEDRWDDTSRKIIQNVCEEYDVPVEFIDCTFIDEILKELNIQSYNTSYSAFYQMLMPQYLDINYNLLYLEGDVIMNSGQNLQEIAEWQFSDNNNTYVYAANIQPESNDLMKKSLHLKKNQSICNVGVLLISCINYKLNKCYDKLINCIKDVGKFECNSDLFLWNYAFRNEIMILPLKYQLYPVYNLLSYSNLLFIFSNKRNNFYSLDEYNSSVNNPCFIHFVNIITRKPWQVCNGLLKFPYNDLWDSYCEKTIYDKMQKTIYSPTTSEKLRWFLFFKIKPLWMVLCRIGFYIKWKNRLKSVKDYPFYYEV